MVAKNPKRIEHRTMRGKVINMDQLREKHGLTPAVGNMKVNARGDELGKGGKIIRTREEVMADYYKNNDAVVAEKKSTLDTPDDGEE